VKHAATSGHDKVVICLVDPKFQYRDGLYIENYPPDLCTHIVVESRWIDGKLWDFASLDVSNSSKNFGT
jgi:hypothetical protein